MKTSMLFVIVAASISTSFAQTVPARDTIPQYISIELKRIEQTWQILDSISIKIWPNWINYTNVPFVFMYPNGVQLIVGYPKPPEGSSLIAGFDDKGKKAYLDRRKEIPLAMSLPLIGGGGPIPYGMVDGKRVTVVRITSRSIGPREAKDTKKEAVEDYKMGSENQILINIHELFHCHQNVSKLLAHGNLRFNNDENYATYAEIEGLALERAYLEPNNTLAKEYLKDFLAARQQKRQSMDERERLQESGEDVAEGTATFTEFVTATLLTDKFTYMMTKKDDPYFLSFRYADSLKQEKLNQLRSSRSNSLSSRDKCYSYGCFQSILLTRLFPGWRDGFFQKGKLLDQTIDSLLLMSSEERGIVAGHIKSRYGYDTIYTRHVAAIGKRNQVYEMVKKRQGFVFVVDFKNIGEFLSPEQNGNPSIVGMMHIYPQGIKRIKIADVVFEGKETPMVNDQLYYIKWIDTEVKRREKRYEVQGDRDGNVYNNAVFKTGGFILNAPKIEIRENKNRVKVIILAKVKQQAPG